PLARDPAALVRIQASSAVLAPLASDGRCARSPPPSRRRERAPRRPNLSAAVRGWGIAATPPALAEDRDVRSEPRGKRSAAGGRAQCASRSPAFRAAARGWGIAATPPALARDRDVRSEPRGKRSAAGGRAQRASRRCPTLAPPPRTKSRPPNADAVRTPPRSVRSRGPRGQLRLQRAQVALDRLGLRRAPIAQDDRQLARHRLRSPLPIAESELARGEMFERLRVAWDQARALPVQRRRHGATTV